MPVPRWLALSVTGAVLWALAIGHSLAKSPVEGVVVDAREQRVSLPEGWQVCDTTTETCFDVRALRVMAQSARPQVSSVHAGAVDIAMGRWDAPRTPAWADEHGFAGRSECASTTGCRTFRQRQQTRKSRPISE
jgi:hypothetical protein